MNVSLNNGWGIVRMLIDRLRKQEDGRFVLVKDPNNVSILMYTVSRLGILISVLLCKSSSLCCDCTACLKVMVFSRLSMKTQMGLQRTLTTIKMYINACTQVVLRFITSKATVSYQLPSHIL